MFGNGGNHSVAEVVKEFASLESIGAIRVLKVVPVEGLLADS